MEIDEREPHGLRGWHVVEAGMRQVWPFLQLADPSTGRELRIYLDTDFEVLPHHRRLDQEDERVREALDSLMGLTVTGANAENAALQLSFDEASLVVAATANHLTAHEPWWFGPSAVS